MTNDKMIVFLATEELKNKLVNYSKKKDRTYGYVCRKAIEKYLEAENERRDNRTSG